MSSNIEFVNSELNGGFLSGFVESSVEKPADGLNGSEITTDNVERVNENEEKEIATKEWDGMKMKERLDIIMKEKKEDSMMEYDIETGRECGVWKKEEKCYAIKRGDEESQVVVADLKTHEMRVYDGCWS